MNKWSGRYRLVLLLEAVLVVGSAAAEAPPALLPSVIPAPAAFQPGVGNFELKAGVPLRIHDPRARWPARYLVSLLRRSCGVVPALQPAASGRGIDLVLAPAEFATDASQEAYRLEVTADGIRVSAPHPRGLFYGVVTLWQLVGARDRCGAVTLAAIRIDDTPRFAWRGYMLDSARHFESVVQIEALLDAMAIHKLNTFHWHLTDDQGWRLQILAYPRLTEVGGCRRSAEEGRRECGWYSQSQIRRLVRYAAARNITIVPEIDLPGHATAAIAAYPRLGVDGKPVSVSNRGGIHSNLFNVDEATFEFLDTVMGEVAALFPGPFVHVGGDEARKEVWEASAEVKARMEALGVADSAHLQAYFIGRLQASLARRGKRLIGWDEILEGGLPANAVVMSWRGTQGGLDAVRQGHDVVMSPTQRLYLDYLQTASSHEPAGRLALNPLRSVYDFEPVPDALAPAQQAHVLGLQANLWTGLRSDAAAIQHNTFPRLAAVAETGWSPRSRKDYSDFLRRLPVQLRRYRALRLNYARTPFEVGIQVLGTRKGAPRIVLAAPLPYAIHYTLDGRAPTAASPLYEAPLAVQLPVRIRAATFQAAERLAPVTAASIDAGASYRREATQMSACPDAPGPALRLQGPAAAGRRFYNVDLLAPCWLWPDAPLHHMHRVRLSIAKLPFNFLLTAKEEARRRFLSAATVAGELDLRLGGCDGVRVASLRLPARTPAQGPLTVEAPLQAGVGRGDVCIRFSGDTRPTMWVLERMELRP